MFHAGAPRRLSLYQIAQIINRVGGYDPNCLMGMPRHARRPDPAAGRQRVHGLRQADPALGCDPFDPWPYCDALVPTHADWHRERPPGEPPRRSSYCGCWRQTRTCLMRSPRGGRACARLATCAGVN